MVDSAYMYGSAQANSVHATMYGIDQKRIRNFQKTLRYLQEISNNIYIWYIKLKGNFLLFLMVPVSSRSDIPIESYLYVFKMKSNSFALVEVICAKLMQEIGKLIQIFNNLSWFFYQTKYTILKVSFFWLKYIFC